MVKSELFDDVFENRIGSPDLEDLLEELLLEEPAVIPGKVKKGGEDAPPQSVLGQPVEEEEGEVEDESLVSHYLQVVKPVASSKLHLPLPAHRISALGTDRPVRGRRRGTECRALH